MKNSVFTATVTAVALLASMASAQTDITVAIQLEPPNLDPTGGAAQAIDSVLYSNVFEGICSVFQECFQHILMYAGVFPHPSEWGC